MGSTGKLAKRAEKAKLDTMRRHVLVCTDSDCKGGGEVAKRIKKGVAAARLRAEVSTTKVDCLSICKGAGAVVVVYPEGTWYGGVDADLADRIVAEHLIEGRPVAGATFLTNPLGCVGRT